MHDSLKRLTNKTIETNRTNIQTSYVYAASQREGGYTTSKVSSEVVGDTTYSYTYDEIGNITTTQVTRGTDTYTIEYFYDENSQLVRENNPLTEYTIEYYYDYSGNLTSKSVYPYTTEEYPSFPIFNKDYRYTNNNWMDQLTSYDYKAITYDAIGNPLTYLGKTMTWNGRQLLSVSEDSDTISYTYDSDGTRRSKTVNGNTTTYEYIGTQLIHETRSDCELYYTYDVSGTLTKITYIKDNTETDYYVTSNMSGDIDGIYDSNGNLVARYIYDSWGKVVRVLDAGNNILSDTNHIAHINPFRYRGYYYDIETQFYYLQTRYYDPEVCRFINADTTEILGVQANIYDKNLYAYCDNNPVVRIDVSGTAWETIFDVLSLGASIMEVTFNPADPWAWLGLAGDAVDLLPFVTCVGETIDTLKAGNKVIDKGGNLIDTYYYLKKQNKVTDLEIHHIVEKRFSKFLDFDKTGSSMLSIPLPKDVHQKYTNEWRKMIGYGRRSYSKKDLLNAAIEIYKKDPEMLGIAIYTITKGGNY